MRFIVFGTNILARQKKDEKSSIILEQSDLEPMRAEIVAVGDGVIDSRTAVPMPFQEKDIVYFVPRNADTLSTEQEKLFIVDKSDIIVMEGE